MKVRLFSIVRLYLWLLGAGLLLQGAASLVLRGVSIDSPALASLVYADPLHAAIHIFWGAAMLLPLARGISERALALLTLTFGMFYVSLAFLGVLVYHPFGLQLGPGENAFHFIVGPIALVLGIWATRATRAREVTSRGT